MPNGKSRVDREASRSRSGARRWRRGICGGRERESEGAREERAKRERERDGLEATEGLLMWCRNGAGEGGGGRMGSAGKEARGRKTHGGESAW